MRVRRQLVFFTAAAALVGSALEISVSRHATSDFDNHQSLCRMYLCEERVPLVRAYHLQLAGNTNSVESALSMLLDSLVRDPSSAYRWLDVGQALAQAGRIDQASYCIARAVQLGGDSADVALNAGDFYLRYGNRRLGLHYLARTLNETRALR